MKKYLYVSLIIWLPFLCFGQKTFIQDGKLNGILPVDEQGRVQYQLVQVVDSASKQELFKRARQWFVKTYKSGKDVLQVADVTTGEVSGKGTLFVAEAVLGITNNYPIAPLINIEIKDGRYRLTLSNFVVLADKGSTFPIEQFPYVGRKFLDRFYTNIGIEVDRLTTSLQKAMSTKESEF